MAYTLYTDKDEEFMCEIAVKNASLKNSMARMIVDTGDVTLMFEGEVKKGKCTVPIRHLKGLLDENSKGKMYLEVIVEDTYFKPWEDKFVVEEHTSLKVKVNEQKKPAKPLVEVKTMSEKPSLSEPAQDLVFICEKIGITKKNLIKKTPDLKQLVKEYFIASPEFIKERKKYIQEAINALK